MTEQKTNRTEEQLEQELRKSKGGKLSGKILSMLGVVIAVAGIILGGNPVSYTHLDVYKRQIQRRACKRSGEAWKFHRRCNPLPA